MRIRLIRNRMDYFQFILAVIGDKNMSFEVALKKHDIVHYDDIEFYPVIIEATRVKQSHNAPHKYAFRLLKQQDLESRRNSVERVYQDAERYLLEIAEIEAEAEEEVK